MDVSDLIYITDYFVICSGNTKRQVKRITDNIRERMRQEGLSIYGAEGEKESQWVLLDFGDVIVHIFNQEMREYYQIERLWKDAPIVDWENEQKPQKAAR